MAKVKTKNNTGINITTKIVWEYETIEFGWIPEDDERSASFKAVKHTGKIRSYEKTVTTNRDNGEVTYTTSNYETKTQNLV